MHTIQENKQENIYLRRAKFDLLLSDDIQEKNYLKLVIMLLENNL